MPKSGNVFPMESYLNDRKNDIIALSGLNQVLYPGNQVLQATGRALSVVMQGVNNKVSLRKEWWVRALKELNKSILFHAEKFIPQAKLLIGGQPSRPFNMITEETLPGNTELRDKMKELSRLTYGRDLAEIEQDIFARLRL